MSVPFAAIQKVVKIKPATFEKQRNRNFIREKPLYDNMFEIKLKCPFEDIWRYRNEERRQVLFARSDVKSSRSPSRSNRSGYKDRSMSSNMRSSKSPVF